MFSSKNLLKSVLVFMLSIAAAHAAIISNEELFKKLSSLESSGNADVKYNLGMLLNNGIGTARDPKTAFKYFSEAAEAGHELAAYKVGCYLGGQFPDAVQVNQAEAFKYKLRAAEAGYDLAQLDVGNYFGKKGEFANALPWWERASRQGDMQSTENLAYYLSIHSATAADKIKAYGLMLLVKEKLPKTSKAKLAQIEEFKAKLTDAEQREADAVRASWLTGKTQLSIKARTSVNSMLALIDSLEQ